MAYLHCHSCGWQQDDFYSVDGYNPAKYLKTWMRKLCSDDIDKPSKTGLTYRALIAQEFEDYACEIRKMKWITHEQWLRDKHTARCPKCGKQDFDID